VFQVLLLGPLAGQRERARKTALAEPGGRLQQIAVSLVRPEVRHAQHHGNGTGERGRRHRVEGPVGEAVVDHPDPVSRDAFGADHVVGHRVRVGDEQVGHPGRDPLSRHGESQTDLVVAQAPAARHADGNPGQTRGGSGQHAAVQEKRVHDVGAQAAQCPPEALHGQDEEGEPLPAPRGRWEPEVDKRHAGVPENRLAWAALPQDHHRRLHAPLSEAGREQGELLLRAAETELPDHQADPPGQERTRAGGPAGEVR
jgi:hypothetical protein